MDPQEWMVYPKATAQQCEDCKPQKYTRNMSIHTNCCLYLCTIQWNSPMAEQSSRLWYIRLCTTGTNHKRTPRDMSTYTNCCLYLCTIQWNSPLAEQSRTLWYVRLYVWGTNCKRTPGTWASTPIAAYTSAQYSRTPHWLSSPAQCDIYGCVWGTNCKRTPWLSSPAHCDIYGCVWGTNCKRTQWLSSPAHCDI